MGNAIATWMIAVSGRKEKDFHRVRQRCEMSSASDTESDTDERPTKRQRVRYEENDNEEDEGSDDDNDDDEEEEEDSTPGRPRNQGHQEGSTMKVDLGQDSGRWMDSETPPEWLTRASETHFQCPTVLGSESASRGYGAHYACYPNTTSSSGGNKINKNRNSNAKGHSKYLLFLDELSPRAVNGEEEENGGAEGADLDLVSMPLPQRLVLASRVSNSVKKAPVWLLPGIPPQQGAAPTAAAAAAAGGGGSHQQQQTVDAIELQWTDDI